LKQIFIFKTTDSNIPKNNKMQSSEVKVNEKKYKYEILWFMVFMGTLISVEAVLGIYFMAIDKVLTKTYIFSKCWSCLKLNVAVWVGSLTPIPTQPKLPT